MREKKYFDLFFLLVSWNHNWTLYFPIDPSINKTSNNATLQELMRRLVVTEAQVKGLTSQYKGNGN